MADKTRSLPDGRVGIRCGNRARAAAAVVDGFRGAVIDCGGNLLRVVKVWPGAPVEENGTFTFPVSVSWRCDISR